jgi:hypothetical protein
MRRLFLAVAMRSAVKSMIANSAQSLAKEF